MRPERLTSRIKAAEKAGRIVAKARELPDGTIELEFAQPPVTVNPADLVDMSE